VRLACSTASFPQDRLQIAIAKVAWAGFRAVELAVEPGALPSEDEIRGRMRANELELAAVHAGPLPADDRADVEALGAVGRAAALTRALDAAVLVLEAPPGSDLDALARTLTLLDRALGEMPVDLCLVNRAGTPLAAPAALHALWAKRLPRRAGLALDPGQAVLAGWNPLDLDALPALPRHVYLNDAMPDAGTPGRAVPPGEGILDLSGLALALRSRGYAGSVSLVLQNADPWAVEPIAREAYHNASEWFQAE